MDRKPALADSTNLKGLIIKHFYFSKMASATIDFEFLYKICFLVTSCLTSGDSHLHVWYSFIFNGWTNRSIWRSPFVLFFRLPRHYNIKCTVLRKINTVRTKFSLLVFHEAPVCDWIYSYRWEWLSFPASLAWGREALRVFGPSGCEGDYFLGGFLTLISHKFHSPAFQLTL